LAVVQTEPHRVAPFALLSFAAIGSLDSSF